jgi:hypothetical protein
MIPKTVVAVRAVSCSVLGSSYVPDTVLISGVKWMKRETCTTSLNLASRLRKQELYLRCPTHLRKNVIN